MILEVTKEVEETLQQFIDRAANIIKMLDVKIMFTYNGKEFMIESKTNLDDFVRCFTKEDKERYFEMR